MLLLAFLALICAAVLGRRRPSPADRRRLVVLAGAAAAGAVVSMAVVPADEGFTSFRILPASAAAAFCVYGAATVALDRQTSNRRLVWAASGSAVVIALSTVLHPVRPDLEYGEWTFAAAPQLADQVVASLQPGDYQVQQVGPRSFRLLRDSIGLAVDGTPGSSSDVRRSPAVDHSGPVDWDGQILIAPAWARAPEGWERVGGWDPPDRDPDGSVAGEAAAFLQRHGGQLTGLAAGSVSRDPGLRSLFCPELAFDPDTPCPAADVALATGGLGALPDWIQAVMLVEQFDEQQQTPLLDTPRPPDELLDRLRFAYEELPVEVYARRTR